VPIHVELGKKKLFKNDVLKNRYRLTKENHMTAMTEQDFLSIWQDQQPCQVELEFRLYYDEQGFPLFYSTEQAPGNYVVVDQQTYLDGPKHIRVIDGKLKIVKTVFGKKLAPASYGQACDPRDVCVVVDPTQANVCWAIRHEEPIDEQTD
jgi:hypothetical protein